VPCHRILKGDGSYDNYSGGDNKNPQHPDNIYRKQWLIELEARGQQKRLAS
jgi:O6-methylguanine-DNA--protein-cysteine methyltransferase